MPTSPNEISCKVIDENIDLDRTSIYINREKILTSYDLTTNKLIYIPPTSLPQGIYKIVVNAPDKADNYSQATWTFFVDYTPPQFWSLSPEPDSFIRTNLPTISFRFSSDTNLESIIMKLDNKKVEHQISDNYAFYTLTSPLTEGEHKVEVYAEDIVGNLTTVSWLFKVNTKLPVIQDLSPAENSIVTSPVDKITATIFDEGYMLTSTNIAMSLNNVEVEFLYNSDTQKLIYIPAEPLLDGNYTIRLKVQGYEYWDYTYIYWSFKIDTQPPQITYFRPRDTSTTYKTDVSIVIDVTDNFIGVDSDSIILKVDDKIVSHTFRSDYRTGGRITYTPLTPYPEFTHTIYLELKDKATNTTTKSWQFTIDTTLPPVGITIHPPEPRRFNPHKGEKTKIKYTLATDSKVIVQIFWHEKWIPIKTFFKEKEQSAGTYTLEWNGRDDAGNIVKDGRYYIYIKAEDLDTAEIVTETKYEIPKEEIYKEIRFHIPPAYPLRNQVSAYNYTLPYDGYVTLRFGVGGTAFLGYKLKNTPKHKGAHTFVFNGRTDTGLSLDPLYYYAILELYPIRDYIVVYTDPPEITDITTQPLIFNAKNNETTNINFNLSEDALVTIKVFDEKENLIKELLINKRLSAGSNSIIWDGKNTTGDIQPDGLYTIKIEAKSSYGDKIITEYASCWINTPSFKAIYSDTAFGWINPNDSVRIFDNDKEVEVETALDGAIFKAKLTATGGEHKIKLITSRGYQTEEVVYYNEIKDVSANNFNPYNNEQAIIRYTLTAPDNIYIGIIKGPPESVTEESIPIKALVVDEKREAGEHIELWDGRDEADNIVEEGVYTFSILAFTEDKKYATIPIAVGSIEVFKSVVLSNVKSTITGLNEVTITWQTDQDATSQVEYTDSCELTKAGVCKEYKYKSKLDSTLTKNHSITLSNLNSDIEYHYRVISITVDGKESKSRDFIFKIPLIKGEGKKEQEESFTLNSTPHPDFTIQNQGQSCCGVPCWSSPDCPPGPPCKDEEGEPLPEECCYGFGAGGGFGGVSGGERAFLPGYPMWPPLYCKKEPCEGPSRSECRKECRKEYKPWCAGALAGGGIACAISGANPAACGSAVGGAVTYCIYEEIKCWWRCKDKPCP